MTKAQPKCEKLKEYLTTIRNLMPENSPQRDFYQWALDNGECFEQDPHKKSKRIESLEKIVQPKVKLCFWNSLQAAAYGGEDLTYYEGWYQTEYIPTEHAWVVDGNGEVIDLTARKTGAKVNEYFGVPIDKRYAMKRTEKDKECKPRIMEVWENKSLKFSF